LQQGDFEILTQEAASQVNAGAGILDVNVGASGVDETVVLPRAVAAVMKCVDVPVSIDFNKIEALKEALKVYVGKPIVNSVTGEERSLDEVLPLVKEHGAAVIGLTFDERGIPKDSDHRLAIAHKIVERAESTGISREDVIIDSLALTIGSDSRSALVTLETIRKVKRELGVNQTLGASNISFGLPNRSLLNQTFLAIAIVAGVTCPTVDAAKVRSAVLATDLILGRDRFALRYIEDYRKGQSN
jgi:5-methyltetrahydrofolate--homocysteine methyltransferase